MMQSLTARLLLAVSLLLLVFFSLTIFLLDISFRNAAERAIRDRWKCSLIVLLAAAEVDDDGSPVMPDTLPEALPESRVGPVRRDPDAWRERLWRSPSLVGRDARRRCAPSAAAPISNAQFTHDGASHLCDQHAGGLPISRRRTRALVFTVAESLTPVPGRGAQRFRRQSSGGVRGAHHRAARCPGLPSYARLLRLPSCAVSSEIVEIEEGARAELGGGYPTELRGVARKPSMPHSGERARLSDTRQTLGNLAHSLKTPPR